jgi:transcriptional regulator with GAF, ATPase, and Fis domain/predicted Ser/Thr protein kinase/DNA-binding transcriptional ArsR family regulator/predicted negative regulator of RcsB-dependent stress response
MELDRIGNRYEVERELGRGGMGVVYLVREEGRPEPVALKVLTRRYSESAMRHFEQEFRTLTGLSHPSLTEVYDFGRHRLDDGREVPFFTMQFVDGVTLGEFVRPPAREFDALLSLLAQVGQALAYLHGKGLVHQDVKPSNVMVVNGSGDRARVKLMDLGLAGQPHHGAGPGQVRGTAAYLSPEAARGGYVDARSDLYSVGCVAYELLTGRPPFRGSSALGVLRGHLQEDPLPPSSLNRAIPRELEQLVLKLLAKDPGLRYAGARPFLAALNEIAGGALDIETPEIRRHRVLGGGFAGRREEVDRLDRLLADARQGIRRLALVVGEEGIGKSRLLREFQVRCQLDGNDLFVGRRDEAGSASSVVDAVARAIRSRGPLTPAVEERHGSSLAVLLGETPDSSGYGRFRLFEAAAAAVEDLAARGPVLLAFEDLHRADEFSCALLGHLVRAPLARDGDATPSPVFLLGSYRGEEVSRSSPLFDLLGEVREEGVVEEIFLGPLGIAECGALLRAMLGAEDVPEEFGRRMWEETRGNPLHLGELAAHLAEEGYLEPGSGEAIDPSVLADVRLPGKIRAILGRRLGRVGAEPRTALQAAAALGGDRIDPDALAAITGMRWEHVVRQLLDLLRLGLVTREEDDQGSPVYRLAHRGLRELVAETTPEEESRLLHARAVSYLERRGVPRRHAAWAVLADHAERGGQPGRAIDALSRAGELARGLHAHREAVDLFGRALELARREGSESTSLLCGLFRRRGEARLLIGDPAAAEEDFRWMLARAEKDGDDGLRADAHLALGKVLSLRSRDAEAQENLELALEIAGDADSREAAVEARIGLGRILARQGQFDQAIDHLEEASREARDAGRGDLLTESLIARGEVARDEGDFRAALESFREAEAAAGDRMSPALQAAVEEGAALALEVRGEYPQALEALERARRRAADRGDTPALASLTSSLGIVHLKTGDHATAERLLHEALAVFRRLGSREGIVRTLQASARMDLYRGRYDRGLKSAEEALRTARRLARRDAVATSLGLLGSIRLRLGDLEGASSLLDEAGRSMREDRNPRWSASYHLDAGDLDRLRGEAARAVKHYQESAFLARKTGDRRLESTALCRLGQAHLEENAYDRARVACRKALSLVEEAGLPREEADGLSLRSRIELSRPGGDVVQARGDAREALERYRALGEPEQLWRAEHLAGRAELRLGQREDARERIERAHRYLEKVRGRLSEPWAETFLEDPARRELYDDWERLRSGRDDGEAGEAGRPEGEFARLKKEAETLRRLLEINRRMNSTRETDELLGLILDETIGLTGAERGVLLLRSEDRIEPRAARSADGTPLTGKALTLSRSIAARTMEAGEPLLSTDAEGDERFSQFESVHDLQIRSVMALPLRIQDEVAGAVYLDTRLGRREFTATHLDLAARLADQAGLALDTARMLENIEEQRASVDRLNRELEKTVAAQRDELALVREELSSSRTSFELRYRFEDLVGASTAMQRVYHLIEKLAVKKLPVLIVGESGTGKELIARALHRKSDRSEGPFFTVNCAALTETLLESELFGYKRGAFTGADRDKPGYFQLASGGTLFLDEIGEMGTAMQAKLLRAIERGEFMPVGAKSTVRTDVRVVAATHRDLRQMIAEGSFREDLFYRVNVGRIEVPPLRDRREDVPLLVDHFLTALAEEEQQDKLEVEPAALRRLAAHDWPGNVRELQHQILRVATFTRGPVMTLKALARYSDIPAGTAAAVPVAPSTAPGGVESLEETEKRQILRALEEAGGNKTRAAEILGINRATLFRKLKRFELQG